MIINPVPIAGGAKLSSAVVLLSGGQDSATCLALAKRVSDVVHAVMVDYGQRHLVELRAADAVAETLEIPEDRRHRLVLGALNQIGDSSLINPALHDFDLKMRCTRCGTSEADAFNAPASGCPKAVAAPHRGDGSLPASFVPGRNSLLLSLAAAVAYRIKAEAIFIGCSQVDYSGYPDCRGEWLEAKERELRLGVGDKTCEQLGITARQPAAPWPQLVAPLLRMNKGRTFALAERLGVGDLVREVTHTCYNGSRDLLRLEGAGRGCGDCPSCVLRLNGWGDYKTFQPVLLDNVDSYLAGRVDGWPTASEQPRPVPNGWTTAPELPRPIPGCAHADVDGTCGHPQAISAECHTDAPCPEKSGG